MTSVKGKPVATLYLCYQGIIEPLTQTQVVPYLEGLSRAGYDVVLLTFEPRRLTTVEVASWQRQLAAKGITWYWLRYHKSPTVPATAWDIASGSVMAIQIARRHRVRLVHARSYVPGVMAAAVKRATGARLLLDIRGFMADEYVDVGNWPAGGTLYRTTKRMERWLAGVSDGYVVLTNPARAMWTDWYPALVRDKPLEVIPCCVDLRHIPREDAIRPRSPSSGSGGDEDPVIAYVGKLGGWYMTDEMAALVATFRESIPQTRWRVWTQSDPTPLREACARYGLSTGVEITRAAPEALLGELTKTHAALSLIRPSPSKRASSPTKVGEYLGAGVPVISTTGIGDVDALLSAPFGAGGGAPVGVLIDSFSPDAYRRAIPNLASLLEDPTTSERCRNAAEQHLDLVGVGWARYVRLYQTLLQT